MNVNACLFTGKENLQGKTFFKLAKSLSSKFRNEDKIQGSTLPFPVSERSSQSANHSNLPPKFSAIKDTTNLPVMYVQLRICSVCF